MNFIEELKKARNLQNKRLFTEAKSIYNQIINKDKNNYEANIGLAIIYFLENKVSDSTNLFKKLIAVYPNRVESYQNFSNILISQNKFEEAIVCLLNAYKINNKNVKILENLCFLYYQLNNFYESKKFAKLAISLDFKNFFIYNIFGQIYSKEGEIDESIINFKLSIKFNKFFWPAYDNLLTIYEQVNNIKEFNKLLIKCNEIFKDKKNIFRLKYFESLLLFRNNEFSKSLSILKEIENKFDKKDAKYYQFFYDLLGKNYDKLKKYDLAFDAFNKRNVKILNLKENKKFDKKILYNLIESYSNFFVKENINKYNLFNKIDNYPDPVFLVGFPRSGTTLLDTILRTHSHTIVLEEKPYISNVRDEFFKFNNNKISSLEKIDLDKIKDVRKNYFKNIKNFDEKNFSKIIVDKLPLNIIEIGFIKRIFPKSKFILMMRHPVDSILSCFVTNFAVNEAMIHFLELNDAAKLYTEVFNLWKQYKKNLDLDFHVIKYENIIADFEKTIKKLLIFLNIEWEDNIKNFNKIALKRNRINTPSYNQVIKPLSQDSIGRWKNYNEVKKIKNKLDTWIEYFDY